MKTPPTPLAQFKAQARRKLRDAVNAGVISRGNCEICGTPNGHGHHEDYSRPLDVRWLCGPCHRREHTQAECRRGHPFTPENTYVKRNGKRACRACLRALWFARWRRERQLTQAA